MRSSVALSGISLRHAGSWLGRYLQIDHDLSVNVALDAGISVAHDVVPRAAIAALGHQLLPPRAPERVLALLGAQLDYRIEEGEVEAPHLDSGAPRGRRNGRVSGEVAIVRLLEVLLGGRGDDGLDGGEGLGQATRKEQLGGLSVGFGDLLRVVPGAREGRHGRAERARAAQILVQRSHGG